MASVRLDQNGDCSYNPSVEQLLPSDSSDSCDDFREPDILPRIGDEYQVEIPLYVGKSVYILDTTNPTDAQDGVHSWDDFCSGLPIPLTWVSHGGGHDIEEADHSNSRNFDVEPSHYSADNWGAIGESENVMSEDKLGKSSDQNSFPIPGLFSDQWSDLEKSVFLLCLYIFEKNFVQFRRFIESKQMGSILSFYYGKFYGSDVYRRWSEGRKMRNKRSVYGYKIFSGLRQQEFLSRILPSMSEECQNALVQVSKLYGEGKLSLQDYISSLKAMVGMNVIVEAVAIGKGEQDLTGMALETSKSSQGVPVQPEIPTGKAWSSLATSEIIKFLTGDYRLSKARSKDLFWEAVWPRLLARGWHSEKPKDQSYITGSNHGLVFLIPGVKKFSRRKLAKGEHYFDSVSDVLSKVAKEPGMLELEIEEDDHGNIRERDNHDLAIKEHRCYLRPPTPTRSTDTLKLTVVDTSLSDGKPFKVRQLKNLPCEISDMLTPRNCSKDSDEGSAEETTDESESTANTMVVDSGKTDNVNLKTTKFTGEIIPGKEDRDANASYQETRMFSPGVDNMSLISVKNKKNLHEDNQSRNLVYSSRRKQKQENIESIAPIKKRHQGLTAYSCEETSSGGIHSSKVPGVENMTWCCTSGIREISEHKSSEVGPSQDKLSSTSSPKDSRIDNIRCTSNNTTGAEATIENPQTQTSIDLNFPQVPSELENGFLATELQNSSVTDASYEQQPSMNMRRHSTRNRPLTTRALEAIANGFLTVNRRQKNKNPS